LYGAVSAVARLAYDNETLLVPGVVVTFTKAVETRLEEHVS
jgi:hypothetical protein